MRELPKRGGWPDGAVECQRFVDEANIDFYDENGNWDDDCLLTYGAIAAELVRKPVVSCEHEQVTFDQYQSALAALQKVEWSGAGLPPIGCACEMQDSKGTWIPVDIIAKNDGFTFGWSYDYRIVLFGDKADEFRPLRTEADKKRDAIAVALIRYLDSETDIDNVFKVSDVIGFMDYVASGKVPGVKLED